MPSPSMNGMTGLSGTTKSPPEKEILPLSKTTTPVFNPDCAIGSVARTGKNNKGAMGTMLIPRYIYKYIADQPASSCST